MRWNKDKVETPSFGDMRIVTKFAFFTIDCDKGHTHWLENVKRKQWRGSVCWWDTITCICPDSEAAK